MTAILPTIPARSSDHRMFKPPEWTFVRAGDVGWWLQGRWRDSLLDADGLRLHAIVPAGTALPAEGEAVVLTFNREHLHLMDEPA